MKALTNKRIISAGYLLTVVGGLAMASACNTLDLEPRNEIGPNQYYKNIDQLKTFTIAYYNNFRTPRGNWYGGQAEWDNGTDNQAGASPNKHYFYPGEKKTPATGGLKFDNIRNLNWFLNEVKPLIESGKIAGSSEDINHYLGEAYFFRAFNYFDKLVSYGDFPILTEAYPDNEAILKSKAKRMPRNEVARFIIEDLERAIELLKPSLAQNQLLTKRAAHLFLSRVALFEATFEKYHQGSARVPAGPGWPGANKEWNQGKNIDLSGEINFFLDKAIEHAKIVADATPLAPSSHVLQPTIGGAPAGWNTYYDLFSSQNPSSISEVILWCEFSHEAQLSHSTSLRLQGGLQAGWTRSLVQSFLMKNGLPIYATGSGYHGDDSVASARSDRDERLQLFLWAEGDPLTIDGSNSYQVAKLVNTQEASSQDVTGYRQRKLYSYNPAFSQGGRSDISATIIFRASEAYLNYIEASYLRKGMLDADARKYWTALRDRAGITGSIDQTIAATDMSYEANTDRAGYDWGAFSAGTAVDATTYSIRRERRSEFAGEGYRWHDLLRWRAMDQVSAYQIEGVNFFTHIKSVFESVYPGILVDDESKNANISKTSAGQKYLRPYQKSKVNNEMYDGYTWTQAHYLEPFSTAELLLCSPTNDPANSNLYQNPGWSHLANQPAQR